MGGLQRDGTCFKKTSVGGQEGLENGEVAIGGMLGESGVVWKIVREKEWKGYGMLKEGDDGTA